MPINRSAFGFYAKKRKLGFIKILVLNHISIMK